MRSPVELKTDRLVLRPFNFGDVDDVFAYASDPDWARYLLSGIPQPYTRRDAEEFIARSVITSWDTHPVFAIVLDEEVIGGINLRIEPSHRRAEMGYGLNRKYWGQGLTAEAGKAVIGWAFGAYDLAKVFAQCDARNERSWRVMEKIGMRREAHLLSHMESGGVRVDVLSYGLLKEAWDRQQHGS